VKDRKFGLPISACLLLSPHRIIDASIAAASSFLNDFPLNLEQAEMFLVKKALEQAGGNISKAADLLGVNRARIYRLFAQSKQVGPILRFTKIVWESCQYSDELIE